MSSTTPDKATQTSPAKSRKRNSKKVAKTSARKSQGSSTGARKKATTKKAPGKKSVSKKRVTAKSSKSSGTSKKATVAQERTIPEPTQANTAPANGTTEDSKSLSWMAAQAANALKAVKASQAEKGQAVLERTRKQATENRIDDDSLMKIAAEMPFDDDALSEFSAEEPFEEFTGQAEASLPAAQPVLDNAGDLAGTIADSNVAPATAFAETEEVSVVAMPPAEQAEATTLPSWLPASRGRGPPLRRAASRLLFLARRQRQ
jgi:hypothetical protein